MIIDLIETIEKDKLYVPDAMSDYQPDNNSVPITHEVYINKARHLRIIGRYEHYITYCIDCELEDIKNIDFERYINKKECYEELRECTDYFMAFEYGYGKIASDRTKYYQSGGLSYPNTNDIQFAYKTAQNKASFFTTYLDWKQINDILDMVDEDMKTKSWGRDYYSDYFDELDPLRDMEFMLLSTDPLVLKTYERYLEHRSDEFQCSCALR